MTAVMGLLGRARGRYVSTHRKEGSMPFKSKAQRRKFAELLVKGEISPETYEEWNRETGRATLPERVHPKPAAKPRRKKAGKAKRATAAKPRRPKKKARKPARRRRS